MTIQLEPSKIQERDPDHIVLYQKNIEAVCSDEAEIKASQELT